MNRIFGTRAQLAEQSARRPAGYDEDIRAATLEESTEGIWFDADHPAFEKYRKPIPYTPPLIHGAIGLTKAVLHIGRAEESVIESRRAICGSCEHHAVNMFMETCSICGCAWQMKILNASEKCPIGKWPNVS
jgi:hypothetical protein